MSSTLLPKSTIDRTMRPSGPSAVDQVLAQIHLYENRWADQPENQRAPITVEVLPKKLDEEVAALMVEGFGGVITRLTPKQADYIGVPEQGPFKADHYRY